MIDLRARCLRNIDISAGRGLEIGPLDRPLLPRSPGRIFSADHCSTETLRNKYAGDPAVTQSAIRDVDFDLSTMRLNEAARDGKFDYVVASHVIEHVPDLIGWLRDIEAILVDGGKLALVVPDRRFTFDFFRRETQYWMVEQAIGRTRPDVETVVDYVANVVSANTSKLWTDPEYWRGMRKLHSAELCADIIARHAGGEYIDAHCWVFTPQSFDKVMNEIIERAGLQLKLSHLEQTPRGQHEFYAQLSHAPRLTRAPLLRRLLGKPPKP